MSARFEGRRLHFVGVGGAGMSALALAANQLGASVTGSDRTDSSYLARLRAAGIEVVIGHDGRNVPEGAEVVLSTAIAPDNPESVRAREAGLETLHRSEFLAELCDGREVIAVAGTHGKTTTTAMLAWALASLGRTFAFFVGGEVPGLGPDGMATNAGWSSSGPVLVEADESDGSFLRLDPAVAVVTNVEMDHHSTWDGLGSLKDAFARFADRTEILVLPEDDQGTAFLTAGREAVRLYGPDHPGPEPLDLLVPGRHNLWNARAAIAALQAFGEDPDEVGSALSDFPGVRRRLEFRGEVEGSRIYDDYAHHPTEVRAAIEALRSLGGERLTVVFQPHLYSRTKALAPEFGRALAGADQVVVTEVYPAREVPEGHLSGVSGLDVLRETADRNGGRTVYWAADLDAAERAVKRLARPGGVVATLGAGDVTSLAGRLLGEGKE